MAVACGHRHRIGHDVEAAPAWSAAHCPICAGHVGHIRDEPCPIRARDPNVKAFDHVLREDTRIVGRGLTTVRIFISLRRNSRLDRGEPDKQHERRRDWYSTHLASLYTVVTWALTPEEAEVPRKDG
jgi:hypothetical protein